MSLGSLLFLNSHLIFISHEHHFYTGWARFCVCVCRKWVSGESGFQLKHFPQNSREFFPFIMKITDNVHNMSPPAEGFIQDLYFEKWIKIQNDLFFACILVSWLTSGSNGQQIKSLTSDTKQRVHNIQTPTRNE